MSADALPFADRLTDRMRRTGSVVCMGIDPRPERHASTHPDTHDGDPAKVAKSVVAYFRAILGATHEHLAAVKPQSAFFERMGIPGMIALAQLIADAKALELPVVLDAKRGDIGSTAEAYADAYLGDGVWGADALTVNPYLGFDTLEPFAAACDANARGVFVLVRTSNPGAGDLQDVEADGEPIHRRVAAGLEALNAERRGASGFGPLGAVVGATAPEHLAELRGALPSSVLLVPGYGAQGGGAADVAPALRSDGTGALISASRSLTYVTEDADLGAVAEASLEAVASMRDAIGDAA